MKILKPNENNFDKNGNEIYLRAFKDEDLENLSKLFYETIHSVNAKDYSAAQLDAWANSPDKLKSRRCDLSAQRTLVAEIRNKVIGFGSIDCSGYLDLLYVHKDYQRRGVATALCDELEKGHKALKTYSSITAKPFFIKRGYVVTRAQEVERGGVRLRNFEMVKTIKDSLWNI